MKYKIRLIRAAGYARANMPAAETNETKYSIHQMENSGADHSGSSEWNQRDCPSILKKGRASNSAAYACFFRQLKIETLYRHFGEGIFISSFAASLSRCDGGTARKGQTLPDWSKPCYLQMEMKLHHFSPFDFPPLICASAKEIKFLYQAVSKQPKRNRVNQWDQSLPPVEGMKSERKRDLRWHWRKRTELAICAEEV